MLRTIRSALLIGLACVSWVAPAGCDVTEERPPLPFDQWILGPDRHDFAWKVHLLPPQLTFQQRYLEQIRVTIPSETLKNGSAQHDLHFLVKVADEQGKWFEPESYTHYEVPPNLDSKHELQFGVGLYVRPGRFTVAVLAYEAVSQKGNLWRGRLEVPSIKDDPLPQLNRDLPAITFIDAFPQDTVAADAPNWLHGSRMRGRWTRPLLSTSGQPSFVLHGSENNGETWDLAAEQPWLPISTPYTVHLDLILNFSERVEPQLMHEDPLRIYRLNTGRLLQISNLLGHLRMKNGCVHLGVLDTMRMQTVLEPVDAESINWAKFEETIRKLDRNTIEIGKLETRNNASAFFRDSMADIMSESGPCDDGDAQPLHVILIAVSSGLQFPSGTRIEYVKPQKDCKCRIYYLRPQSGLPEVEDDLEKMLKPIKPHRFTPASPLAFRRELASLISEIEAASRAQATIH